MCDLYKPDDLCRLLKGKHVAVFGGSVMRGLYKDIVWLLNDDSLIPKEVLGEKAEQHFPNLNVIIAYVYLLNFKPPQCGSYH